MRGANTGLSSFSNGVPFSPCRPFASRVVASGPRGAYDAFQTGTIYAWGKAMTDVLDIEGIGKARGAKLKAIGITSVDALLKAGATPKGRKEMAEKAAVPESQVLEWVNRADLFRIKGVGEEYSDLLEAAGVDTVPELAQRRADNLHKKLLEVNEAKKLVRQVPGESQVAGWIEHAKTLDRVVTY